MKKKVAVFSLFFLLGIVSTASAQSTVSENLLFTFNSSTCPVPDDSGTGNSGTCQGDLPTLVSGQFDDAFDFDGAGDEVVASDDASLRPDSMSVSFWLNPDAVSGRVFDKAEGQNNVGYLSDTSNSSYLSFNFGDGSTMHNLYASVSTGSWQHYVITVNSSDYRVYKNGDLVDSSSGFTIGHTSARDLHVMTDSYGGGNYVDGQLDEFRVYSGSLNSTEVQNLYASNNLTGAENNPPIADFTSSTSGLEVSVDGSSSSDVDGSISSYEWDWTSDGTYEATGQTASHTYGSEGSYNITLKVTDDDGATDTVKKEVTVTSTSTLSGQQLYYSFDISSCPVPDESSNSNDGSCTGDLPRLATGEFDDAFDFDGNGDEVVASDDASLRPDSMSVSFWLNPDAGSGRIFDKAEGQNNIGYWTGFPNSSYIKTFFGDGSTMHNLYSPVSLDQWQHYTITLNSSDYRVYKNGDLVDSSSGFTIGHTSARDLHVMTDSYGGGNYVDGQLDEFRVFNRSLEAYEVQNLNDCNNVTTCGGNIPPDASFTYSVTDKTVDVNASGSTDDREISSYEWDWTSDGTFESTGETASHTYATTGDYEITLRVTDNDSATDTVSKQFYVGDVLNVQHMSDFHFGNSEGATYKPYMEDWKQFTVDRNWADYIIDTGDVVECGSDWEFKRWASNVSYVQEQTGAEYLATLGNHDAYQDYGGGSQTDSGGYSCSGWGWNGVDWYYRETNHTSMDKVYSKGNVDYISLGNMNYDTKESSYDRYSPWLESEEGTEGVHSDNPIYFVYPEHKRDFFENQLEESCSKNRNPVVFMHNPLYQSSIFSHDWWGMRDTSWKNTSQWMKNTIDQQDGCKVSLVNGHVHKDPQDFVSNDPGVLGGNIVHGSASSYMPDNMVSVSMPVLDIDHGMGKYGDYPAVFRYQLKEGQSFIEIEAYDVSSGGEVPITYNDSSTGKKDIRINLNSPVDLGSNLDSNSFDNFTQEWSINQFSDEGEVQWFKMNKGFWAKRSGWIDSRWEYKNPRGFEDLNVSRTSGWSPSHEFRVTNSSNLNGWSQWYSDPSNAPEAKYWSVNTSFSGGSDHYIYDMELSKTEITGDTTPPTSSDNYTAEVFVDKAEVPVELSAYNDGGSGVEEISYRTCKDSDCSIPIRDWTTVSGSSVDLLLGSFSSDEKGNVTVQFNATDSAGNVEAINKEYVAFEKGKSAINLSTPLSGDVFTLDNSSSTLVDFNGSIENDDFVSNINLYLNGTQVESVSPDNGITPSFNFSRNLEEANHTYSIEWESGYTGNFYRSDPVSFEVANSSEVVEKNVLEACYSVDESSEFCLENGTSPVSFDSGFTPRDNTSISYNVSAPSSSTGSSKFFGFVNSSSTGFSTVKSGNVTVTVEENTSGNDAPSASFTANSTSVLTGETIEFDGSGSSDVDGSISSFSWDFGDSSTGSGEVVTHSYSSTGDYVVELTVTDDDGASTSVDTTVSVSSDSDSGGGGGGDGGGDGSTDDDNTSTGGTAGLGNISAGLQSPHVDANYFFETFSVMLNESKTVTLDGVEATFELTEVYNESSAGIRQSGDFKEVSEGDLLTVDDDQVAVSDVIDNGNESQIVLSLNDDQNQGSSQGEVIYFYNYTTSSSDEYNVSVQYRQTGIGKDWKTAQKTTVNSVEDNTQASVRISGLEESIYEARVLVENGTDNVSTTPVGFAVGYVPEIDLVAPPNNAEVTRSPPVTTLPIAFTARTIESTDFGGFYVGPSGERYSAGELIEENLRINGSSSDTTDYKLSKALGFFEWLPFFTVNEYGSFVDAFGIPGGTDFFAEFDMSVPVQEGTYTAYVNATSNDTSFSFNTTSSGRSILLNVEDLENSNRTTEISNSFEQETGKTVTNDPVTDESFNSSQTFDNETYYFSSPAVLLRGPRGNYTLDDLSSGEINFNFAMSHKGEFIANRTVVIEANDSVVDKIGLETDDTEYDFNISGSQLSNGSWNESNYSYFVQFENSTDVIWSSEGRTDGELSFQIEEASDRPELTGNFFKDLLIVLNPLTYGQTVATVVSLLLTVLTGVLLRNYREVALAGMISTLIATVALGWTPKWIGLIIFIGGFLVFSDKAGKVIG